MMKRYALMLRRGARLAGRPSAAGVGAVVLIVTALAATTGASASAEHSASAAGAKSYTIGVTGDGTLLPFLGTAELQGVRAAISAWSKHNPGKLNITLKSLNDADNSATAVGNVTQFATQDNAAAIIGPTESNTCTAVADLADQYKVPTLCTFADPSQIKPVNPYVFVMSSGDTVEAPALLQVAKKLEAVSKGRRLGLLGSTQPGSVAETKDIVSGAPAIGLKVVGKAAYVASAPSFAVQAAQVAAKDPDIVIAALDAGHAPAVLSTLFHAHPHTIVITSVVAWSLSLLTSEKNPNLYMVTSNELINPSSTQEGAAGYVAAMKAVGVKGKNNLNLANESADTYLGTYSLLTSLASCGCTHQQLSRQLDSTQLALPGLSGHFGFTSSSHTSHAAFYVYHWDHGVKLVAGPLS